MHKAPAQDQFLQQCIKNTIVSFKRLSFLRIKQTMMLMIEHSMSKSLKLIEMDKAQIPHEKLMLTK